MQNGILLKVRLTIAESVVQCDENLQQLTAGIDIGSYTIHTRDLYLKPLFPNKNDN